MLRTAGIFCGILLFAMSVHAGQENKPKTTKDAPAKTTPKPHKPPQKTASKKAAADEKQSAQSGVVVAVDPVTRQIQPPTPEQRRALGQRGPRPNVTLPETPGPGGAVNVQLGPEFQTYSVITRTPDGKVQIEEVSGEKAAKEIVSQKKTRTSTDGK